MIWLTAIRKRRRFRAAKRTPPELGRDLPEARIRAGREHFAKSKILVCGLARNSAKTIDGMLDVLYRAITPNFDAYKFLIFENDSEDKTREVLLARSAKDPNFIVLGGPMGLRKTEKTSIANQASQWRIDKMVKLRNLLLDEIEKDAYEGFDYVLMVDLDLTGVLWEDGLFDTGARFASDPTIDAISALALELHPVWGTLKYHDPYAYSDGVTKNMTMVEKDNHVYATRGLGDRGFEKVESTFNGLAIYRRASLRGKRYRTHPVKNGEPVCEHVGLHETLDAVYANNELLFILF
jgi:hypothetical protein